MPEKVEGVGGKSDRARVVVDTVNTKEYALPVSYQDLSLHLLKRDRQ